MFPAPHIEITRSRCPPQAATPRIPGNPYRTGWLLVVTPWNQRERQCFTLLHASRHNFVRMMYQPRFERFEVRGQDGRESIAEFLRAGTLTAGDRPELYFFRMAGEELAVGISGSALERFQRDRRLSREEKIDIAGLMLRRQFESGADLDSQNLFIRDEGLGDLAAELGILA